MPKQLSNIMSSLMIVTAVAMPACAGQLTGRYLYTLSDLNGPIPYNWVSFATDPQKLETYVTDSGDRTVRIFNESGMEVYRFGNDYDFGAITAVAVAGTGDIFVLSRMNDGYKVIRCNFRGEPQENVAIRNLPEEFSTSFLPEHLAYHEGHLYLVDRGDMKVAVTTVDGRFETGYDLAAIIGYDEKKRRDSGIVGFNVDRQGDLLFTVPVYFSAYVVAPDKTVRSFGVRGSSPGKFNIVSGITADDNGNLYLTDTLRCVVMVFDKDFNFKTEFGYRGFDPGNLIAPMDIAVNNDKVYVAQSRSRGVSVYRMSTD